MYDISLAVTNKELQQSWGLLYQQYLKYKLIDENCYRLWAFPHYFTKHAATWFSKENGAITTTVSCVFDKEQLLPLDDYYADELNQLRMQGARLAELGLLTAKKEVTNAALLLTIQRYPLAFGLLHGYSDFIIGIHPRRAAYYKSLFGFRQIGENKQYIHLNKAPVALLYLSLREMSELSKPQVHLAIHMAQQMDIPLRNDKLCADFLRSPFSEFKAFYYRYINQKEIEYSTVYHPKTKQL